MARVLPSGLLNPGPFNVKEHVLIALTANCAGGTAYAVDIIVIQSVFYKEDFGFLANFLLILTTQMLGYGMAGVLRRYLVYPAAMIWPANLVQVALFNTLHQDEDLAPVSGPVTSSSWSLPVACSVTTGSPVSSSPS